VLPDFTPQGFLPVPPPVYTADWDEFVTRFGWTPRRKVLLDGIARVGDNLRSAGISVIWIAGSFVTSKDDPGDFDGVWDPRALSFDPRKVDPILMDLNDLNNGRIKQKLKYGGELLAGSETKSGAAFQSFFQQSIDGTPKGIVRLRLRDIP